MPVPHFKIVHFYVDKALNWDYCQKTFELINSLKDKFGIESKCLDGNDDYAYWKALKEIWGQQDLVTIEQDVIFKEEQLVKLLKCRVCKDCTLAFRLYPVTTELPFIVWSIGENHLPDRIRLYREEEKPKFCNFSSLGFTKLSKETQLKVELNTPTHWKFVDLATLGKIKDLKVHVHYEVEHAHR